VLVQLAQRLTVPDTTGHSHGDTQLALHSYGLRPITALIWNFPTIAKKLHVSFAKICPLKRVPSLPDKPHRLSLLDLLSRATLILPVLLSTIEDHFSQVSELLSMTYHFSRQVAGNRLSV
jgi:hypothetical protein